MEDGWSNLSSVRKTVAPFPATVIWLNLLWWCSDCGFVNLNFSVCWVTCISVDYQY